MCTVIDHRRRHNILWRTTVTPLDFILCHTFYSSHTVMSSEIYYSTHAWKNVIYLLSTVHLHVIDFLKQWNYTSGSKCNSSSEFWEYRWLHLRWSCRTGYNQELESIILPPNHLLPPPLPPTNTISYCKLCKNTWRHSCFLLLYYPSDDWFSETFSMQSIIIAIKQQQQYCNMVSPHLNFDSFTQHMTSQTWRLKRLFLNY